MKEKVKEWKYVETKIGGIQKTQARTKVALDGKGTKVGGKREGRAS